jgi:hypothetical protein
MVSGWGNRGTKTKGTNNWVMRIPASSRQFIAFPYHTATPLCHFAGHNIDVERTARPWEPMLSQHDDIVIRL